MNLSRLIFLILAVSNLCRGNETSVIWREDFPAALREAQAAKKPLFVTFRCLPCKQCAAFDKNVLEGGPKLTPLLSQFITVRITNAAQLDGKYFPYRTHQDLDLSWWGYFMSPEGGVYGVFGGKDHVSDSTRISEEALVNTMNRILVHHRKGGDIITEKHDPKKPTELEAYDHFAKPRSHVRQQACLHCHQVNDILTTESIESGTFTKAKLMERWPLPENTGMILDRDHGLKVVDIVAGSPAEKAGIKNGDELIYLEGTHLFSQADLRGALHRADSGATNLQIAWLRNGAPGSGEIAVDTGWKTTENWWRKSIYDGVVGPYLGFFPLQGRGQGKGSLSVKPFMGKDAKNSPWWASGLRPNHEIIEINGRSDDWNTRQFLTWFRLNHEVGDAVTLKVKSSGKVETITGKIPPPESH